MHKEANRPWPVICADDDVVDYMVMEAVSIRVAKADEKARKEQEIKEWKKNPSEELRSLA